MTGGSARPRILDALRREGTNLRRGPTGEVGTLFRDSRFELVWVRKQGESIDPDWFSYPEVDLLMVVQGKLRVEFADADQRPRVLGVGKVLVLPPGSKCRAFRWPRNARRATVFLAVYPALPRSRGVRRHLPAQT
jgi:hypothetical protein